MDDENELDRAARHVREGAEHLANQRRMIAELEAGGHSVKLARKLLATFEQTQRNHEADYRRLLAKEGNRDVTVDRPD